MTMAGDGFGPVPPQNGDDFLSIHDAMQTRATTCGAGK